MSDDWEKKRPKRRREDEDEDADERPRYPKRRRREDEEDGDEFAEVPDGRPYIHSKCGEATVVSEGHFTHICDPFRPCTGTFCVTCNDFFPLKDVRWADTNERISDFRARMRQLTPAPLRAWRSGVGCLIGLVLGVLVGLMLHLGLKPAGGIGWYLGIGGVVGSLAVAITGGLILESIYPAIDYRKQR